MIRTDDAAAAARTEDVTVAPAGTAAASAAAPPAGLLTTVLSRLRAQSRLVLPAIVLVGGALGFLLLPGDLLYAGSTALVAGIIGLALFLPIAALREMPL